MKHFVVLSALIALCCAQAEPPSQIIGVPGPRWMGPIANHVNGQLVGDTPEVAAAKAAHYQAHAQVLSVLPVLPPEERFKMTGIPLQPQPVYNNIPTHIQNTVVNQPIHTSPQFTQFAEEIPRSEIGEVPEVAAARKAHLAAYEEIKKILPKLETVNTARTVPQQQYYNPQPQYYNTQPQYNSGIPDDTPEVKAAKLEHMRLFAALG